jgi:hypothetical protein
MYDTNNIKLNGIVVPVLEVVCVCVCVWGEGSEVITPRLLTSTLDGGVWSVSRPRRFTTEEEDLVVSK